MIHRHIRDHQGCSSVFLKPVPPFLILGFLLVMLYESLWFAHQNIGETKIFVGDAPTKKATSYSRKASSAESGGSSIYGYNLYRAESANLIGVHNDEDRGLSLLTASNVNHALGVELSNFADVSEPFHPKDLPIFFHIPKTGGTTVRDILQTCYFSTLGTENRVPGGDWQDTEIAILHPKIVVPPGDPLVTPSKESLQVQIVTGKTVPRQQAVGQMDSTTTNVDVLATKFLFEANDLFTGDTIGKGQMFAVFRHPIDRAVSMFHYLQNADWGEPTVANELKNLTIQQYAKSTLIGNNWLTRHLSHVYTGQLNDDHLAIAMNTLRKKVVIGLTSHMEESMERFEKFFRWKYHVHPEYQEECRRNILSEYTLSHANKKNDNTTKYEEGSEEWELIALQNHYDLKLYQYIEVLYKEQAKLFTEVPDDFRKLDATCCICSEPTYPKDADFTCPEGVPSSSLSSSSSEELLSALPSSSPSTTSKINEALEQLSNFADASDPYNPQDVPVLLNIPRTGASTVRDILHACYLSNIVTENRIPGGKWYETEIGMVRPNIIAAPTTTTTTTTGKSTSSPQIRVRLMPSEIMERDEVKRVIVSGLLDAMITKYIYKANELFTPHGKGRLFTVFEHPIDRSVQMYNYLQNATFGDPAYVSEVKRMNIEEYAKSNLIGNNWLTRHLSKAYTGKLTEDHLAVAMHVLKTKFVVGLSERMEETMERFEKFFRWNYKINPEYQEKCRQNLLIRGDSNTTDKRNNNIYDENSEIWGLLASQNQYDLKLYDFIKVLFWEQEALVADIPDGFRGRNATCCKCSEPTYPADEENFKCLEDLSLSALPEPSLPSLSSLPNHPSLYLPSSSALTESKVKDALSKLSNFDDLSDMLSSSGHVPVFFHIPKTGGSTIRDVMHACHLSTIATENRISGADWSETEIAVVRPKIGEDSRKDYLRIHVVTDNVINRKEANGKVDLEFADAVATKFIYDANDLFTSQTKGQLFAIFRHPIDRAVSMFNYLQVADWEPTYNPELKDMTIEDYARSHIIGDNWLTRQLSHAYTGDVSDDDLAIAMNVLRNKVVVGLTSDMNESMERFEKIFKWKYRVNPSYQEKCRQSMLSGGGSNHNEKKKYTSKIEEGSELWELLASRNRYDLKLYEYSKMLFKVQADLVADLPDNFRNLDATCCKCAQPTYPREGHFKCPEEVPLSSLSSNKPLKEVPNLSVSSNSFNSTGGVHLSLSTAFSPPSSPSPLVPTASSPPMPPLSNDLTNFASPWETYISDHIPVFLQLPQPEVIPLLKGMLQSCHRFVVASGNSGSDQDNDIHIDYEDLTGVPSKVKRRTAVVNVDTHSIDGIQRAKSMGLADSGIAEVVVTTLLYESNELFTSKAKGRLFSVFQAPMDRAASLLKPEHNNWTVDQVQESKIIEHNFLTRLLANAPPGEEINDDHLATALDVVRTKFLVGLMSNMNKTMERFEKFFGWKYRVNPKDQEICRRNLVALSKSSGNVEEKFKSTFKHGKAIWEFLAQQNRYDLAVYDYVEKLFKEQTVFVQHVADGFRKIDSTCCECNPSILPQDGHFTCPVEPAQRSLRLPLTPTATSTTTSSAATTASVENYITVASDESTRPAANAGQTEQKSETAVQSKAVQLETAPPSLPSVVSTPKLTSATSTMATSVVLATASVDSPTKVMSDKSRRTVAYSEPAVQSKAVELEPALPSLSSVVSTPKTPPVSTFEGALAQLSNIANAWDPYTPRQDAPVLFYTPTETSTVIGVLHSCHRLEMTPAFGVTDEHGRAPFTNVDTFAIMAQQKSTLIGGSHTPDVVVTHLLYEANDLFSNVNKGRLFSVFQDPVDRAIDLVKSKFGKWTIGQLRRSEIIENNHLTRKLSNAQPNEKLNDTHVQIAMNILRTKFLVGLVTEIEETVERFEKFFQWKYKVNPEHQETCRKNFLSNRKAKHAVDDETLQFLTSQNDYDLQVYSYIQTLFKEQSVFVSHLSDDFRKIDSTCCECTPATYPPQDHFKCPRAPPDSETAVAVSSTVSTIDEALRRLSNFANAWDPYDANDIPMLLNVPMSTSVAKDVLSSCHQSGVATGFGVLDGRSHYSHLFASTKKGRLFAVFQHPIDRVIDIVSPQSNGWALKQYENSGAINNNWLTRTLSYAKPNEELNDKHVEIAMNVLRTKFLVGLATQMDESMDRFEKYFRWKFTVDPISQETCRQNLISYRAKTRDVPNEILNFITSQNKYDLRVFTYIETLFKEQGVFVEGIPDGYRKVDSVSLPNANLELSTKDALPLSSVELSASNSNTAASSTASLPNSNGAPYFSDSSVKLSSTKTIETAAQLANFASPWDPYNPNYIPTFLHIPKAGGSTVKDAMGACWRFVMATEFGVSDGHDQDTEIAIVYPKVTGAPPDQDRSPFVNVNTYTVEGIQRAKAMGFARSGLADAVVTNFIYEANDLFTQENKGRLFTVFRHPIDRAISMFYYLQVADWEPTYKPEFKDWTVEQYASSDVVEQDWVTKQLCHVPQNEELNNGHLAIAKEVLRTKFVVGLMSKMDETMDRFEKFFRWKYKVNPTNQEVCRERLMGGGSNSNKNNSKPKHEEGSSIWNKLAEKNKYDLQLYEYIETLFIEQAQYVAEIPNGYRSMDATCCKCDPPTYPPEGFACPVQVKS